MTTPSSPLNQTGTRREVLGEVLGGRVSYASGTGVFTVDGEAVTGARRRTYAELRSSGLLGGGGEGSPTPLKLTPTGEAVAREWGLISP